MCISVFRVMKGGEGGREGGEEEQQVLKLLFLFIRVVYRLLCWER